MCSGRRKPTVAEDATGEAHRSTNADPHPMRRRFLGRVWSPRIMKIGGVRGDVVILRTLIPGLPIVAIVVAGCSSEAPAGPDRGSEDPAEGAASLQQIAAWLDATVIPFETHAVRPDRSDLQGLHEVRSSMSSASSRRRPRHGSSRSPRPEIRWTHGTRNPPPTARIRPFPLPSGRTARSGRSRSPPRPEAA